MENTQKDARAKEQAGAQLASIEELVTCLEHAEACDNTECGTDCTHDEDEAREAITNDALSVQVRGEWHTPGAVDGAAPYAYKILLCWGGPSVRIVGELDEYQQPFSATLQYQDWYTPWTDYDLTHQQKQFLIEYARQFPFAG